MALHTHLTLRVGVDALDSGALAALEPLRVTMRGDLVEMCMLDTVGESTLVMMACG